MRFGKKIMFDDDFLFAIDQGTSSTRVILFNLEGEVLSISQKESTLSYPKPRLGQAKCKPFWKMHYFAAKNL